MSSLPGFVRTAFAAGALGATAVIATPGQGLAGGVFEVIHPDVRHGGLEFESLNGIALGGVQSGEERSVHELAIGYGITDFWKLGAAIEIANPKGGRAELEAFEVESLLLFPAGNAHAADTMTQNPHPDFMLGLYTALEIPREGGIDKGALAVGPVWEIEAGAAKLIGNLFLDIPFERAKPGLAYATQLSFGLNDLVAIGVEAHGSVEEAFGNAPPFSQQEHFAGPAIYFEQELSEGHVIEPRLALMFGLTEAAADAVLSFNVEYKLGGKGSHH